MQTDAEIPKDIRVLIVDDDEEDYFIIKRIFRQIPNSPFRLEWTPSYDEAVKLIETRKHDIYVIDYRLGEHSGLDLLRLASPQDRSEPFIFLTGASDPEVERRSMKLAASDYLVKGSFDADLLSRTLQYALQRKQVEEQRLQQLLDINRTKDEFISIASHQLRTPATGVKQYLGMLLEGFYGDLDPTHHQLINRAYESNERQLRIVADLLKVAQVDAGKVHLRKKIVNLNDLVDDCVSDQHDTFIHRHQTLQFQPIGPPLYVTIDYDSIRMVLENIIDNASKYSEKDTETYIRILGKTDTVCIQVDDEGVGITAEHHPKLYEKFSRIDNSLSTKVGGTGLGLYWAKKIIDLHDGSIIHETNSRGGSTFTICLPKHK